MDLSIVIPAYNEGQRLGPTLVELSNYLEKERLDAEVIVVDDGSGDDTETVAQVGLAAFPKGRVIGYRRNEGKGRAVRTGMLAAEGELRLFMDADGSTALSEISRFIDHCNDTGAEVVIASIGLPQARILRRQPGLRSPMGKAANLLIRMVAVRGIRDTQRGFKLFTAGAAEDLFSRATIDGWLFDVEVLAVARRLGYQIAELPVTWEHREDSRVTSASYLDTLADLARIRWRLWRNGYDLAAGTRTVASSE